MSTKNGFSLIEMMVTVALFSVIAVIAIGAMMSIIDANRKARSHQAALGDVNLAAEKMTREIRDGNGINIANCGGGGSPPGRCEFTDRDGNAGAFFLNAGRIYRNSLAFPVTAPELNITDLTFTELTASGVDQQPGVVVTIQGIAHQGTADETDFNVETVISESLSDFAIRQGVIAQNPAVTAAISSGAVGAVVSVPAGNTETKGLQTVPVDGDTIDTFVANEWCPWAGLTLPAGSILIDIMHGKGLDLDIHIHQRQPQMSSWSNNRRLCRPWAASNWLNECLHDGLSPEVDIQGLGASVGALYFETSPLEDTGGNMDAGRTYHPYFNNTFHTATCQLREIDVLGVTDIVAPKIVVNDYEIRVAQDDASHCVSFDAAGVCTGGWWFQNQFEAVMVGFRTSAGVRLTAPDYADELGEMETANVSYLGIVDFGALPTAINGLEVRTQPTDEWWEDGLNTPFPPNLNGAPALVPPINPLGFVIGTAPGEDCDSHVATMEAVNGGLPGNELHNSNSSLGVGCVLLTPNTTYSNTLFGCPDTHPRQCTAAGTDPNKCKPEPGADPTWPDDEYTCCVAGSTSWYCPSSQTCGAPGLCDEAVAGCGAGEVACGGFCIPDTGEVCCAPEGHPELYCAPGESCSPDGQCFGDGGTQAAFNVQDIDTEEF